MKLALYWSYATRSLRREGQRTILAICCVAIGVLAVVALQLVGNMVNTSLTGNIRALNGGDIDLSSPRISPDQLAYFDQLRAQGAITSYTAGRSIPPTFPSRGRLSSRRRATARWPMRSLARRSCSRMTWPSSSACALATR
jgi:predicted lysophospholipase L1 biosynthesis ABC-type transport system permease subunit